MTYLLINFFIGSCIASHVCVLYERYTNENFIFSRSYCKNCKYILNILDEVPIFSYLFLKGRCKYCKSEIPANLFLAELIGGFTFIKSDFSSHNGLMNAIMMAIILTIAIFDYKDKEFPTILLFLPICIILITKTNAIKNYSILDLIEFVPIVILLIILILKQKLGTGDLFIYILIALYFNPEFANSTFLIASILLIAHYLFKRQNKNFPFIPYILIAMIFKFLWQ